jgi:hypothetical protein
MISFHGIEPTKAAKTKKNAPPSLASSDNPIPSLSPKPLTKPGGHSPFPTACPSKFNYLFGKHIAIQMQTRYLIDIVKDENMPSLSTINLWMKKYPKFSQWCSRSRTMFADYLAERSGQLFDEAPPMETIQTKNGVYERISMSGVQRERYKSQAMQWQASKWNQERYGERLNVQNTFDLSVVLSSVNAKGMKPAKTIEAQVEQTKHTA